jgi:hypothetical protein
MYVLKNTGNGTIEVSEEDLNLLAADPHVGSITITGSYSVSLLADFNNRMYINEFEVYTTASKNFIAVYGATSSGVLTQLTTQTCTSGVKVIPEDYYTYIRLDIFPNSNVLLYGISEDLTNSDIKFGIYGNETSYGIDRLFSEPQEIKIKNDSSNILDFYVFLNGDSEHSSVELSAESSGVFYSLYEKGLSIPNSFSWYSGEFINTVISGSSLVLSGSNTVGYYVSPVFTIENFSVIRPFFEITGDGYLDFPEISEGYRNIGVKFSNNAPTVSWSNGNLPDPADPEWSFDSGSLSFIPYSSDQPLTARYNDSSLYVQFYFALYSYIPGTTPFVSKIGVEYPTTVSGILPASTGSVFSRVYPQDISIINSCLLEVYSIV